MGKTLSPKLLCEIRRLLALAGAVEHATHAGFDLLPEGYPRDELAAAVIIVTAGYLQSPSPP